MRAFEIIILSYGIGSLISFFITTYFYPELYEDGGVLTIAIVWPFIVFAHILYCIYYALSYPVKVCYKLGKERQERVKNNGGRS